jgi:hypothetical protein
MADFEPGDKVGGLTEPELIAFITHRWNARIATVTPDGWLWRRAPGRPAT